MAINENNYVGYGPVADGDTGATHTKHHLPEAAEWEEDVYQVETSDYVVGGANGIVNLPHAQLTNRTKYLKVRLEELARRLDEATPDSEDYNAILREIRSLDLSAVRQQVAHLERLNANLYLVIQMAGLDPDGYDGMIAEPLDGGAKDIDQTVVEVVSVVSGDDSIDVSDSTNLIVGAHYQLTDGENIEEVQVKRINSSGNIKRVVLYDNVRNQYKDGRAKLYRSSVAITNGRAYGGGGTQTDTWDANTSFTGSNTTQNVSATVDYSDGDSFDLTGITLDNGKIVYGGAAVGIALVQSGGGAGTWTRVDPDGDGLPTQNFNELYPWNGIETVTIDGQTMAKIPKFYVKYGEAAEGSEYAGKKCHWVSETKKDGYHVHPAFVRNGVEKDYFLIGAYEAYNAGSSVAGSKSGQTPWVNIGGHANAIAYCNARNTNADDTAKRGWHLQTIYERAAISLLMLIELGTPDVQTAIAAGNVGSNAAVATGSTAAKWRGICEYWGNVWEHTDGFKTDGNSKGQIFSTQGDGTYVDTGVTVAAGWIKEVSEAKGTNFDLTDVFVPSVSDGTEANGTYGDYCWVAANCVLYQSGGWAYGSRTGAFVFDVANGAAYSDGDIGLRLAKYAD
jgi:hypothetical protein